MLAILLMILGSGEFPGYSVFGSLTPNQATGGIGTLASVAVVLAMVRVMPILVELAVQVIGIH